MGNEVQLEPVGRLLVSRDLEMTFKNYEEKRGDWLGRQKKYTFFFVKQ